MHYRQMLLVMGCGCAALVASSSSRGVHAAGNGPIVFESTRGGNPDIFTTTDGKRVQQLTSDPGQDTTPSWSPDAKRIAFASNRTGAWKLYLMSASGSALRELKTSVRAPFAPRFSPDGTQIAFQSFDERGRSSVHVIDVTGQNERTLSPSGVDDTSVSWSPKGDRVVLSRGLKGLYGLYVVDVATGAATRLTKPAADFEPDFSPSGDRVAFTRLDRTGNYDVYVMKATPGAKPIRLTRDLAEDGGPVFSPDGTRIAFRTSRSGVYALWVMTSTGQNARRFVTPGPGVDVAPDWAAARAASVRLPAAAEADASSAAFFCKKNGTNSGETIAGTNYADFICAWGGNDKIRGYGAGDQIDGGTGNERFYVSGVLADGFLGGDGDDILYAQAKLAPTPDCDFVDGGGGPDTAWVDKAKVPCSSTLSLADVWKNVSVVRPP